MDDDEEQAEAVRRNDALLHRHGRIPSYSLWTADSVGKPADWPAWWTGFNAPCFLECDEPKDEQALEEDAEVQLDSAERL
jgi:hypothetical protein